MRPSYLLIILIIALLPGCATLANGPTQEIDIESTPPGARVLIDDQDRGVTPTKVALERQHDHHVVLSLPGYQTKTVRLEATNQILSSVVFGGLLGGLTDLGSGAHYELYPQWIEETLEPEQHRR